ncbi:MAG: 1-(5-phosphoribosyl)-5-[(5-phosphoribosylamino)methylideneamino]imidazole-4-carboxamide isomerase [Chloroflexi bacterium]|nr:1-(5-phosphoribosyl)-5-[(5-phosphoribosylamino)methylideneamino]imidazole-4-carboxamide isomerase [Chloroflexota bacterium]
MLVIPAIDIKDGKCVRLYQGDYERVTVFGEDPVEMALRWQRQGAKFLHLVDLDGAAAGRPCNLDVVEQIVAAVDAPVEVGGGIRDLPTIGLLLQAQVHRVVLGTAAVENQQLVKEACARWGEQIVVGIDARGGKVATRGWKETVDVTALELAREMVGLGVARFVYTDISRDGTLTEPNYEAILEFVRAAGVPVIASGGVSTEAQIERLRDLGVEGVIVGKALYTGDVDLASANRVAEG